MRQDGIGGRVEIGQEYPPPGFENPVDLDQPLAVSVRLPVPQPTSRTFSPGLIPANLSTMRLFDRSTPNPNKRVTK